jgi:hypothetical protein
LTNQPLPAAAASLDLALIGNCTVGALVDRAARIVWCCLPRFDSTPVFDALLRSTEGMPRSGVFTIASLEFRVGGLGGVLAVARGQGRAKPGAANP